MANASTLSLLIEESVSTKPSLSRYVNNAGIEFEHLDDIIERFEKLRFARNRSNACNSNPKCILDKFSDEEEEEEEDESESVGSDDDEDDDDKSQSGKLVERGPIRPQFFSRDQPYSTACWPTKSPEKSDSAVDYDTTAEQILRDKDYSEKLNPCLDQLESVETAWISNDNGKENANTANLHTRNETASLPSIVVDDPGEDSLLEILSRGGFQAAQVFPENNISLCSATKAWPDSPLSGYNVRSESRASSRAQSPGSGTNVGSPLMHANLTCSPVGSPKVVACYRVPPGLSSSSSSNQSYGDTPSPIAYQTPLNRRIEDRLGEDLDNIPVWNDNYEYSSGTVVNTTEVLVAVGNANSVNAGNNGIDSSELQLVEEVIRDMGGERYETEEAQVVPKSRRASLLEYREINENIVSYEYPNTYRARVFPRENSSPEQDFSLADIAGIASAVSLSGQSDDYLNNVKNLEKKLVDIEIANAIAFEYASSPGNVSHLLENDVVPAKSLAFPSPTEISMLDRCREPNEIRLSSSEGTLTIPPDLHIPEMVTSFESCRSRSRSRSCSRRNSDRNIIPWPSLNLPSVNASERLKEGLKPKDVEKAMSSLLKRPVEELAKPDEDGDTMLMCLVGNPEELVKKRAYLAPLVERLGTVRGALSMSNNRGDDALYLAAINCPEMSYVAGYLAAAMLQKGIDISQRLYHTRGDTLIHSVAARGDSHGDVLAELLALRTGQGNAVFDLSKRNYDGRTALHVAVESHDPWGRGVISVATVRLLLKHGADPKIKETKCGDTALHMAVSLSSDPALVKALVSSSSSDAINATNYNQNTALHMAAAVSHTVPFERQREICWLLVHAGGQSNLQNRQGKTALALVSPDRKEPIKRIFYKKS